MDIADKALRQFNSSAQRAELLRFPARSAVRNRGHLGKHKKQAKRLSFACFLCLPMIFFCQSKRTTKGEFFFMFDGLLFPRPPPSVFFFIFIVLSTSYTTITVEVYYYGGSFRTFCAFALPRGLILFNGYAAAF